MTDCSAKTERQSAMRKEYAIKSQREKKLEGKYIKKEAGSTYIAGEDLEYQWTKEQVESFDYLWNEGYGLLDMAKYFKRDEDEVLILMVSRIRDGAIDAKRGNTIHGKVGA